MTITEILFKKPLAVMGNIVLIVLPSFGTEIYDFFIQNKIAAWMCLTSILIAAAVVFSKRRTVLPSVLKISAFIVLISFPRMAAPGGNRLNTVLVVVIVSLVIALFQKSRKGILIALCILVIDGSYASVEMFSLLRASVRKHAALCKSLENYGDQYLIKYISYFSPEVPTSNSFYFFRHHAFGADSTVVHSGIVIGDYRNWFAPTENVLCALSGDTLEIASRDPSMDIEWDEDFHPDVSASQRGSARGYSKVSVIIPDTVYAGNAVILTPNGDTFSRVR